ncbi:MAG: GreA/GreB family elongation factor [Marinovum algicola]|uniref:GreA/GreB family elongation factor n=1 Tax=Marinovum algicola TaxID=42444 RepID=UPI0032EB96E7
MNKAFTKEDDGGGPERLPDLPISPHPNHVTPRGLALLKARAEALEAEVGQLRAGQEEAGDLTPLAVAERDLRYVEARVSSAILVTPPEAPERVQFGTTVTVVDEEDREASYTIVGEDEAEPEKGLITHVSPLARALLEAEPGDVVDWVKPSGVVALEVLSVRPAEG